MSSPTVAPRLNKPRQLLAKLPRRELLIIAGFALIAIIFTWPLVLNFRESVPGEDHKDAWQMVWNLWWVRYALEHGQNPLQTDLLFYPQGTGLYLHALNLWNGLVSLPAQYIFGGAAQGAVAGYNFIVLLSFTLGAYGAYRLALWLWGDWRAGLVAGLAFGFSTYHFDHLLGHLNLISSEFIPFYILYFLKTLTETLRWRRNAALAVLFLIFNTFLELQYVLYLAIFSAIVILYITIKTLLLRQAKILALIYGKVGLIAGAFLLLTLPFTIPLFRDITSNPNAVPERQDNIYSADLLAYFYPSPFQPLWGQAINKAIKPWTASLIEKVVFPGYTLYLLIIAGLVLGLWTWVRARSISSHPVAEISKAGSAPTSMKIEPPNRQELQETSNFPGILVFWWSVPLFNRPPTTDHRPTFRAGFWLLIAGIYALFSFGRRLHINGVEKGPPLPGGILFDLPILNVTRVPSRYGVLAILALGLVAAWGLIQIGKRLKGKWQYSGLVALSFGMLAFELFPAPYPLTTYNVPQFYRNLANDPARYAIFDLPVAQYETAYLEAQMEHRKPLLGGYISRNPLYPPYYGVPVFQEFRTFESTPKPDILPQQPLSLDILRYWGVRYVVMHNVLLTQGQRDKILSLAAKLFPSGPVYQGEDLTVFEVTPSPTDNIFFYNPVMPSWYEAEADGKGRATRWAKDSEAKLDFWTGQPRQLELDLPIWSFNISHPVDVYLNGVKLPEASREIGLDPQTLHLSLDLKVGQNQLVLKIGGKATRPSNLAPDPDTRLLTVGVGPIRFS